MDAEQTLLRTLRAAASVRPVRSLLMPLRGDKADFGTFLRAASEISSNTSFC